MNIFVANIKSSRLFLIGNLMLRHFQKTILITFFVLMTGCIKQFIPEPTENQDILVVEGLITDQPGQNTIKVSTSMPLGVRNIPQPLAGCIVDLSDDLGNTFSLSEKETGIYITDPSFQGVVGRSYTLHLKTSETHHNLSYQSFPVIMRAVPPIDSLYYDKIILSRASDGFPNGEGCQIYLDTHDPDNICRFYRWEYIETWKFILPYYVQNRICWESGNSDKITIKNTTSLSADRVDRLPINLVTNKSDRLIIKYSILVNQYSLNEKEYEYWEKLQNVLEQVGSLYDLTPASIPSNISCVEKPAENVLGYFSVSSVKSRRIYIRDKFRGMPNLYFDCENKTVGYNDYIEGLNIDRWVIIDHPEPAPGYKVLTFFKECADCTARGTNIKPDFWDDSK